MPEPFGTQVHIDQALSDISVAYKNSEYIADRLSPRVPVAKQSDKYFVWDAQYWFRNYVQERTPGDTYPEAGIQLSNSPYACLLYHLAFPLPDEVMANQDAAVQLEQTGADWLADQFALNRELYVRDKMFKTSVWTTDWTGGTNFTKWSDFADSDPLSDIKTLQQTIQKATAIRPMKVAMGQEVWDKLSEHPLLLDKFRYTTPGAAILGEAQVASALGVSELVIGSAIANQNRQGASTAMNGGYIWGDDVLLYHVASAPGLMTPTAAYTFEWDIEGMNLPVTVSRIREENRDRDLLKAKYAFDTKIVAADLGAFLDDVI